MKSRMDGVFARIRKWWVMRHPERVFPDSKYPLATWLHDDEIKHGSDKNPRYTFRPLGLTEVDIIALANKGGCTCIEHMTEKSNRNFAEAGVFVKQDVDSALGKPKENNNADIR